VGKILFSTGIATGQEIESAFHSEMPFCSNPSYVVDGNVLAPS
jgi:hypothetical protein